MIDDTPVDDVRTDGSRTRKIRYEGDGSIATTIVLEIAGMEGTDPTEMEPLYGAVDPELLEALCADDRQVSGDVMFTYRGHRVTVVSDGGILIRREENGDPG